MSMERDVQSVVAPPFGADVPELARLCLDPVGRYEEVFRPVKENSSVRYGNVDVRKGYMRVENSSLYSGPELHYRLPPVQRPTIHQTVVNFVLLCV